jgi:hypothetical protein
MPPPYVHSREAWMRSSTPADITKRKRGKELTAIDMAMDAWQDGFCVPQQKIAALIGIAGACDAWVEAKKEKQSENTAWRMIAVTTLRDQVVARLAFERIPRAQPQDPALAFRQKQIDAFEERKRIQKQYQFAGGTPLPVRPLHGGYAKERESYIESDKTAAASATTVHTMIAKEDGQWAKLRFDKLTLEQFNEIAQSAKAHYFSPHVKFYKKADRITKLIIVEQGLMWDGPNNLFDTGDAATTMDEGLYPYAIDEYGNLISVNEVDKKLAMIGKGERFNHSTLNAGKNVVCAGTIGVKKGQLTYIDTSSGHYQPTKQNLRTALLILRGCKVDLTNVTTTAIESSDGLFEKTKKLMNTYNAAALADDIKAKPIKSEKID